MGYHVYICYVSMLRLVIFAFIVDQKKRSQLLDAIYQVPSRFNLEKGPFYPVLFEVYFGKRSILSNAFWAIFWRKVHFIQCYLKYILKKGPFYPVLLKVYFGSPFYPVLFKVYFESPFYPVLFKVYLEKGPFYPVLSEVYFEKRSILSSAFKGIFWKSVLSSAF